MAISPPNFAKNAVPTVAGWRHPRTNELLKAQNFTQEQIDEYLGVGAYAPKPARKKAAPKVLRESPVTADEVTAELFEDIDEDEE